MKGCAVSDWIAIERWSECERLARPGFVFEIENGKGQSLFTGCGPILSLPFDWSAAPVRFRLVREGVPERSAPIPPPRG
jgi:hypothetical protein